MKKVLLLLVIIVNFFAFQSALKKYDELVLLNFNQFTESDQTFILALSGTLSAADTQQFQTDFDQLLTEYKINCYQRTYQDNQYILWTNTNDQHYLKNIPLTEGSLTVLEAGDYYFSDMSGQQGELFNPIKNEVFKLYYLNDFSDPLKSVFNPYYLQISGTDNEASFERFTEALRAMYPNLAVFTSSEASHVQQQQIEYRDVASAILTGLLVILILNAIIIRQTKKVQLLKLEGYSNWEIYLDQVGKYLGVVTLVTILTNFGLYWLFIHTNFASAKPFLGYLSIPVLIFLVGMVLFSGLSFVAISLINPNTAIKGKSALEKQKVFNYILKVGIVSLTTIIVVQSIGQIKQYINLATTEADYLARIEHLYTAAYRNPQSMGTINEFHPEADLAVKEQLSQENDYFETTMLEPFAVGNQQNFLFGMGDQAFAEQQFQIKTVGTTLLIPEPLIAQQKEILAGLGTIERSRLQLAGAKVTGYQAEQAQALLPNDYLYHGNHLANTIYLITDAVSMNISNSSFFTFSGDEPAAQAYFDQLYQEAGYASTELVRPVKSGYLSDKFLFMEEFKLFMPVFVMILLVIIINSLQLSLLDCAINDKKYALQKSEGSSNWSVLGWELSVNFFLLLIAEVILYQFTDLSLRELLVITISYAALDVLLFWSMTSYQQRHFAERIR